MADNKYAQAYYETFILSLIICLAPFKFLAYLTPFIGIFWFSIRANSGITILKFIRITILFLFVVVCYIILYNIFYSKFLIFNTFLSFMTYGSFIFLAVIPKGISSEQYLPKYLKVIKVFILMEAFFGLTQMILYILIHKGVKFDYATGDIVQGTLNIMAFIYPSRNFNNTIFTFNLAFLLIYLGVFNLILRKSFIITIIGGITLLLASVMHVMLSLTISVAIIVILFRKKIIPKLRTIHIIIVCIFLFLATILVILQPNNVKNITHHFDRYLKVESPKAKATVNTVTKLPQEYPTAIFFGLGPGQYSSRAGLIASGKYYGSFTSAKSISLLPNEVSIPFDKYVYYLWEDYATNVARYGNSVSNSPYFSWIAIYAEFGIIITALIFLFIFFKLKYLRKVYLSYIDHNNRLYSNLTLVVGVVFVFLTVVSLFENYLETTQAIFPGILLTKFFYDQVIYRNT